MPEWDDKSYVRWRLDHMGQLNIHGQEVLDNMTDYAHFVPVHGSTDCAYFENEFRGPVVVQRDDRCAAQRLDPAQGPARGQQPDAHNFAGGGYRLGLGQQRLQAVAIHGADKQRGRGGGGVDQDIRHGDDQQECRHEDGG